VINIPSAHAAITIPVQQPDRSYDVQPPGHKRGEVNATVQMLQVLRKDELQDGHEKCFGNRGGNRDKENLAYSIVYAKNWDRRGTLSLFTKDMVKDIAEDKAGPLPHMNKADLIDYLCGKPAVSVSRPVVVHQHVHQVVSNAAPLAKANKELRKQLAATEQENAALNSAMRKMAVDQQKAKQPCKFYMSGTCFKGRDCKFSHDISRSYLAIDDPRIGSRF